MAVLKINISIDVDVDYFEKKTKMTDAQIAEMVYECILEERKTLAMEARIAALHLLNDEGCYDEENSPSTYS